MYRMACIIIMGQFQYSSLYCALHKLKYNLIQFAGSNWDNHFGNEIGKGTRLRVDWRHNLLFVDAKKLTSLQNTKPWIQDKATGLHDVCTKCEGNQDARWKNLQVKIAGKTIRSNNLLYKVGRSHVRRVGEHMQEKEEERKTWSICIMVI